MSAAGHNPLVPRWLVLVGTSAGYSSLVRTTLRAQRDNETFQLLVFFGVEDTFPFRPRPSTILVPGMPEGVIASIPALEEVGIASRLASTAGLPGCHDGTVTELAELWLRSLESDQLQRTHIAVDRADAVADAVTQLGRVLQVTVMNIPADDQG